MGSSSTKPDQHTIKRLQNICDLTVSDIEQLYREFKSMCPKEDSDALHVKDFINVYNSVYRGSAVAFAEQVFRTFDTDRNGRVDFCEFIIGLNRTKDINWAFDMYDLDGNGYVSKEEMRHLFSVWYRMTGIVPANREQSPRCLTENAFKKMDSDGDCLISLEEFESGVKNEPFLVDLLQCHPNIGERDSFDR